MTRKYLVPDQTLQLSVAGQHEVWVRRSGNYRLELSKPGVEVKLLGRWRLQGKKQLKIQLVIHHLAAHTKAETDLKAAVFDQAEAHLNGLIRIEPACPGVESFLTGRVLLMSPSAKAETVPELEILSDDVHCSHAASTSPPDEQQIFYLMSRGVSRDTAQKLLVAGFLLHGGL